MASELDTSIVPSNVTPTNGMSLGFFQPHARNIGGLIADVTIEENERDELVITEHPVEQGAPIADHAFKRPEEVVIRAGWSLQKSGDLSAESGIYGFLLGMQASFRLFDLYTGKRRHRNMIIQSLWVTTDQTSEYALMVTIIAKELILTKTQTANTGQASDPSNQVNPGNDAPTEDGGPQTTTEVSTTGIPNTSAIDKTFQLNVPNTSAIDKGIESGLPVQPGATSPPPT